MGLLNIIRRMHLREQLSIREISRRTGLSRNTVSKYLTSNVIEPRFATPERASKLDPFADRLEAWLKTEASKSRKQRRTVKQMHADLVELGFDGSYGRVAAFARKWKAQHGQKLHFTDPAGDKANTEYPEGYLRWLIKTHHVAVVTYDPYQLHDFCGRLSNEHLAYFEPFQQGSPRLVADKQLYDIIKNVQIVHDGNPDLHEHIRNANRTDEDADKLRIVKRATHLHVDLCVALSMGCAIARAWNIG